MAGGEVSAGTVRVEFEANTAPITDAFAEMHKQLGSMNAAIQETRKNQSTFNTLAAGATTAGNGLRGLANAATAVVGSTVNIGASMVGMSEQTSAAMSTVQNAVSRTSQEFHNYGGTVAAITAGIIIGLTAIGSAITGLAIKTTIELSHMAQDMHNLALRTGMTVGELTRLQFAASITGVNFGSLTMGVRRLSTQLVEARDNGMSPAAKEFQRMGIDIFNAQGKLKSIGVVLTEIRRHFSSMTDTVQRNAEVQKTLGRVGMELLPLFSLTDREMTNLMRTSDLLGLNFEKQLPILLALDENLGVLKGAWLGFKIALATQVAPFLTDITGKVITWWLANKNLVTSKVVDWVKGLVGWFTAFLEILGKVLPKIGEIVPTFQQIINIMANVGTVTLYFVKALQLAIEEFRILGTSAEIAFKRIELGAEALVVFFLTLPGKMYTAIGTAFSSLASNMGHISGFVTSMIDTVATGSSRMLDMVITAASHLPDLLGGAKIRGMAEQAKASIAGTAKEIKDGIGSAAESLTSKLTNIGTATKKTGAEISKALTPNALAGRMGELVIDVKTLNGDLAVSLRRLEALNKQKVEPITAPTLRFNAPTGGAFFPTPPTTAVDELDAYRRAEAHLYTEVEKGQILLTYNTATWKLNNEELKRNADWLEADSKSIAENATVASESMSKHAASLRTLADIQIKQKVASGDLNVVEAANARSGNVIKGINDEIAAIQRRFTIKDAQLARDEQITQSSIENGQLIPAAMDAANKKLGELGVSRVANARDTAAALNDANDQYVAAIEQGLADIDDATRQQGATRLSAEASIASSRLRILQLSYVDESVLREARLVEIQKKYEEEVQAALKNADKIRALDQKLAADRMGVAEQFPTFFQKQMKDIVASNAFSVSQIISTWTSGIANAIVRGGNFAKAAWESTQIAIIQGVLNAGVQLAAQYALQLSVEWSLLTAAEAAKLGLKAASHATEVAMNETKNAAIVASDAAAGGASVGIWAGVSTAIVGGMTAVAGAVTLLWTGTILPFLTIVGTAVTDFLVAIGTALGFTGFGAPLAVGIFIAAAALAAVVVGLSAIKFAHGGIVTGPTMGMIGESGSKEAVIPLNDRGAGFMAKAMGMGGARREHAVSQTIVVEFDGKPLMKLVANNLPSMLRLKGLPA